MSGHTRLNPFFRTTPKLLALFGLQTHNTQRIANVANRHSVPEIEQKIASLITVTRADVVAAKQQLVKRFSDEALEIRAESDEWAHVVAPGAPTKLVLWSEALDLEISQAARAIVARLSVGMAAWELVRSGIAIQVGPTVTDDLRLDWTETGPHRSGQSGEFRWDRQFVTLYPEKIRRPVWYGSPSDLSDSDLYLQRLVPQR
jgi:hypothetical protein